MSTVTAMTWLRIPTARLGIVSCLVAMCTGPPAADRMTRSVWLLHGREGSAEQVRPVVGAVAAAAAAGALPPCVVVVPDGPWSQRMGWWADSAYTGVPGGPPPGRPVETGLLQEVLPAVENAVAASFGAPAQPMPPDGEPGGGHSGAFAGRRVIAGISMGGAAALRWVLRPDHLFDSALLLSPAVYRSAPPFVSSARTSGAFGVGAAVFDGQRFAELAGWESLLVARGPDLGKLEIATLVGDGEVAQEGLDHADGTDRPLLDDPEPFDLDLQAARLHAALRRRPDIATHLRVTAGGHDLDVWCNAAVEGLQLLWGRPVAADPSLR